MPIRVNNVTKNNGGTSTYNQRELALIRYNNTSVWRKTVTLTNLVGGGARTDNRQLDAGYNDSTYTLLSTNLVAGHKYFVRGYVYTNGAWTMEPISTLTFYGATIASVSGNDKSQTNNIMQTVSSNSGSVTHRVFGSVVAGTSSWCGSTLYMLVDVTPLEEATGRTFTASQFWSYIGSSVFYGSKDFVP